jgi:hypothetical protein
MSRPNSFDTLAQYALQQLGAPVIDIHVAEEQVQNRIEDAFDFFREFHGDATERMFLKHVIMDNQITVPSAMSFVLGETVTGSVTGTTAQVTAVPNVAGLPLQVNTPVIPPGQTGFAVGETIVGSVSNTNGVISAYATGDMDNQWIPVGSNVLAVANVFPIAGDATNNSQFSASYQIKVNDIYQLQNASGSLATGGLAFYEETKDYLNTMDSVLSGTQIFRYNAKTGKLYIDFSWRDNLSVGQYILVDTYTIVDEEAYTAIWNDRMLKKLTTAYIKKQWGNNLKLHSGIILPGGITVNGQSIYDEAMDEIDKIEDQIRDIYQEPVGFLVG